MALRFIDSCAHYGTSVMLTRKWTSAANIGFQSTGGRRNGSFLTVTAGSILKTLTHQQRYIQGAAIKFASVGGAGLVVTHGGYPMAWFNLNNDHTVSFVVDNNGSTPSSIAVADPFDWHYYEFDCTLGGQTGANKWLGTGTVRVDGNTILTGVIGTSNALANGLLTGTADGNQIGINSQSGTLAFMDYYCTDTNASDINSHATTNTGFLGDVEIDAVFPDADVTTNWSKIGGTGTASHWNAVNEVPPDDDTSYVFSTATGSIETFNYTPIPAFDGTLIGAQYLVCMKKTAEGLREVALTVGGTNVNTIEFIGTANYLADYYIYYIAPLDSDNGVAWGTANFNAEAFGVKLLV